MLQVIILISPVELVMLLVVVFQVLLGVLEIMQVVIILR